MSRRTGAGTDQQCTQPRKVFLFWPTLAELTGAVLDDKGDAPCRKKGFLKYLLAEIESKISLNLSVKARLVPHISNASSALPFCGSFFVAMLYGAIVCSVKACTRNFSDFSKRAGLHPPIFCPKVCRQSRVGGFDRVLTFESAPAHDVFLCRVLPYECAPA